MPLLINHFAAIEALGAGLDSPLQRFARYIQEPAEELKQLGITGRERVWSYESDEAPDLVEAPGYFTALANHLRPSDLIFLTTLNEAGEIIGERVYGVEAVTSSGAVTISTSTVASGIASH
jgi:phosphoribulokinase